MNINVKMRDFGVFAVCMRQTVLPVRPEMTWGLEPLFLIKCFNILQDMLRIYFKIYVLNQMVTWFLLSYNTFSVCDAHLARKGLKTETDKMRAGRRPKWTIRLIYMAFITRNQCHNAKFRKHLHSYTRHIKIISAERNYEYTGDSV